MSHRHEGPRTTRTVDADVVQTIIKIVRDIALFVLGAAGFIHELTRTGSERPQILIMSAAMMGLPLVLRGDEKRSEVKSRDNQKDDSG